MNFILDTDSYKLSHFLGYNPEVQHIYSYAESRGSKYYPATVLLGVQRYVKQLANTRITKEDIQEAADFAAIHGVSFNLDGWTNILNVTGGSIPVRIKAAPEGSLINTHNVLVTVENTLPSVPWLTSYIETALLRTLWYPSTVATRIHYMKQKILPFFEDTAESLDALGFALLDFSARGCSNPALGGLGHLVSFVGSDNLPAILEARRYYDEPMAAFSVNATEHSITTSWFSEDESIEYLIKNMMPRNGILSMVGDTWNIYEFTRKVARYKELIAAKNGTLVIRPDSGDIAEVLPEVIKLTANYFGSTKNSLGYGVLNGVKILWGDGINEDSVTTPFEIAKKLGISADSIMTGSGGGIAQANIDRDTCKFAFKASNMTISGIDYSIAKDPITDAGKRSKRGRLALVKDDNNLYSTVHPLDTSEDQLRLIYEDGGLYNMESLAQIRERLRSCLEKSN